MLLHIAVIAVNEGQGQDQANVYKHMLSFKELKCLGRDI